MCTLNERSGMDLSKRQRGKLQPKCGMEFGLLAHCSSGLDSTDGAMKSEVFFQPHTVILMHMLVSVEDILILKVMLQS